MAVSLLPNKQSLSMAIVCAVIRALTKVFEFLIARNRCHLLKRLFVALTEVTLQ